MDANERRTRASAAAAEWWLRLQSDSISRAEKTEYIVWLCESAVHVAEMLRIAQVHNALEQFDRWARIRTDGGDDEKILKFSGDPSVPPLGAPPLSKQRAILPAGSAGALRRTRALKWAGALVASCLLALAATSPRWIGQTIETDRGERREVALEDGSVLQVDPETKLRVKLDRDSRNIILEQGRALFRVAKDPKRPFTVRANDTIVRAVGTAFAVDRQHHGITVTVAEGKVAIIEDERNVLADANRGAIAHPVSELTANEQITVTRSNTIEPVRKVDSGRELAWTQGRLIFDNDTIGAATEQFNRYNRIRLRVADSTLANRRVSGIFNASDPESFIAFVQTVTHIRIDRDNKQEITIAARE